MEHEMKISPSVIRRLRTERGWPQEQLAIASGLSLRTIQRVEAEGIASMSSAVSLAAALEVQLIELQSEERASTDRKLAFGDSSLFLGVAVITMAIMSDGARPHTPAQGHFFMTINILAAIVGMLVGVPALVRHVRQRQYVGIALALLGTPLITLLATGLIFGLVSGHVPTWQLASMGAAGIVLVVMAAREFKRAGHTTCA